MLPLVKLNNCNFVFLNVSQLEELLLLLLLDDDEDDDERFTLAMGILSDFEFTVNIITT